MALVDNLDELIREAWDELRQEAERAIWWDEQEIVFPFYAHLKPKIERLNKHLKGKRLYVVPQYAEKASRHVGKIGERATEYPAKKIVIDRPARSKKVDLAIIEFDCKDFEDISNNPRATYWHIKHVPLILLEFKKTGTGNSFLKKQEEDLNKMATLRKKYEGIERTYFCCVTTELPSEDKIQEKITKAGIQRVCCGTGNGEKWSYK